MFTFMSCTFSSGVLHCGAQNVKLNSMNQMLLLEWDDDPSCSALHDELIYELVVFIAGQQVHYVSSFALVFLPVSQEQMVKLTVSLIDNVSG